MAIWIEWRVIHFIREKKIFFQFLFTFFLKFFFFILGSGRIASIIDDEFIAVLTSVAENANYRATQTELAQRMTDEMGFKVCRSTVRRAMVQEEWVRQRQKTRPHLLEHHISHRLDWAAARRAERANWKKDKKIVVDIHVDEKWFYAFKTGAWLYLPPGVEPPILVCKSKRFIPKVMFIAAVAEPRPEFNFDGRILSMPIVSKEHYQNNATYGETGDEYSKCVSMNGKLFKQFLQKHIPKLCRKFVASGRTRL